MRSRKETRKRHVFPNAPFDSSYEPLFVALIAALVSLGRTPRSVLEIPETGSGRLTRIFRLIRSCPVSIHDLSRVGLPARFNMPFELGIAFCLSRLNRAHQFIVFEARRHRLQMTLSDLNGVDPGIHSSSVNGMISAVLSHLGKPTGNPSPSEVLSVYRQLDKTVGPLKAAHHRSTIFSRSLFNQLVDVATRLALNDGLIVV